MNRKRPVHRPGMTILLAGLLLAPAAGWAQQTAPAADAAQVETLENAVRTLTAETSGLKEQLRTLEQAVAERDQRLAATDRDVAARDVRIKALETDLGAARAATAAPEARAKALEADVATARAETEASAARVKSLGADVATARAEVANLTTRAEAAAAAAAGLESRGREADAALQQAKAQLAERDGQLQAMRADLLAARNDLSSAEVQLAVKLKENAALAAAGRELVAGEDTLAEQLAALKGGTAELQQELTATQAAALDGETRSHELEGELTRLTGPDTVFFNQLRQALGSDSGAVIENDRFIFPADVAFQPASARLKPQARVRALEIGRALATAGAALPADLDWVIRIDGHTDRQSVGGRQFASNRELAAARALEVVEVLTEAGVPPERLVPAAFGEFRPLDPGESAEAYRRNRRIELRLDEN
jgi:chemotaxis protein MotB